ncbi:MAG: trypco2 family protein [Pseudonocardiaceae bacterium]
MGGVVAERVELAQVIGQLRQELSAAMREGEGEDLRFELGTVELELTVAVSREAGPNAKVRFWVIELGADATVSSQATQRITLTLDPHRRGVAGKPIISGPAQPRER